MGLQKKNYLDLVYLQTAKFKKIYSHTLTTSFRYKMYLEFTKQL